MNIVCFANHDVGCLCLQRLIKHNFKPTLVVAQKTDETECLTYQSVEKLAQSTGIETFLYERARHDLLICKLEEIHPDLIISVAWRYIFRNDILKVPKIAAINFHGSLLPRCRGANPTNWAIISGAKETGVTAHFIDEGIDTGDIILQKKIKIDDEDTAYSLRKKQDDVSVLIMDELIAFFPLKKFPRKKQDNAKATFFRQRKPEDGFIQWDSMKGREVYNFVRALTKPYPGAYTFLKGARLILWKVAPVKIKKAVSPGKFEIDNEGNPLISTLDGYVSLIEFEYDGDGLKSISGIKCDLCIER